MSIPLNTFETRLLAALLEQVPATEAAAAPPPRRRRRLLLAVSAVGTATVLALAFLPGLGTAAAYSVQEGNAGEIEVEVRRFEDAAGLEAALAERGVEAQITYVPNGGQCVPGRYAPVGGSRDIGLSLGSELFRITLGPGAIREGETLVVDASLVRLPDSVEPDGTLNTRGIQVAVTAEVTRGPVPACVPTAAGRG